MDIYYTKKQTENISGSCSYLLLKTLFYFISQCTSIPILKVACVNKIKSWTTASLHLFSQETYLLMKVIMNCVNIKLWDSLGCFHYILNAPRKLCTFCYFEGAINIHSHDFSSIWYKRFHLFFSCWFVIIFIQNFINVLGAFLLFND